MAKKTKTEHSGAKNGGGFWGTREEAKTISKSLRRNNDKDEVKEQLDEIENEEGSKKSISKEAQILIKKGLQAAKSGQFTEIDLEDSNWIDDSSEIKAKSK